MLNSESEQARMAYLEVDDDGNLNIRIATFCQTLAEFLSPTGPLGFFIFTNTSRFLSNV
jgi:hypothetical protein